MLGDGGSEAVRPEGTGDRAVLLAVSEEYVQKYLRAGSPAAILHGVGGMAVAAGRDFGNQWQPHVHMGTQVSHEGGAVRPCPGPAEWIV